MLVHWQFLHDFHDTTLYYITDHCKKTIRSMFHTEASSQNIKTLKITTKKKTLQQGGGGGGERERERERDLALRQNLSFVLMPRHVGHGGGGGGGGWRRGKCNQFTVRAILWLYSLGALSFWSNSEHSQATHSILFIITNTCSA